MNRQNGNKSPKEALVFSLFTVLFMVYWTYSAIAGGAPVILWAFGGLGLYTTVRNTINTYKKYKNSKNDGQYIQYTDYSQPESSDPWDKNFRMENQQYGGEPYIAESYPAPGTSANFCPYCGVQVEPHHDFCKNCGRQLPD